jgi:hypothetical protein
MISLEFISMSITVCHHASVLRADPMEPVPSDRNGKATPFHSSLHQLLWTNFNLWAALAILGRNAQLEHSVLHSPTLHGFGFDEAEDHILHEQPNQDDRQQTGEHLWDRKIVLGLEDVPAKPALT